MAVSVKKSCNALRIPGASEEMSRILTAMQQDIANLRAAVVGITAQLDADAGVTGTNFAANNNPAALNSAS